MKLLVIGGSYFYGRVFVMLAAKEHDITVVNRGTYSLEGLGVRQILGDRHLAATWERCGEEYDAVIDFCAYRKGDIACVLDHLAGRMVQYILISTVDVYERGTGRTAGEDSPLEERRFPGEAGEYISGKVDVERELYDKCREKGVSHTILRPAILYGPYNYAPRESVFIQMAVQNGVLPRFTDADGRFQFVYVKDAAQAILNCIRNEKTYGQAYNLCQDEIMDYDLFFEALRNAADPKPAEIPMTVAQAREQGILLPFPVEARETELVKNDKSREELGLTYTDFREGMKRTWKAFSGVFAESDKKN